MEKHVNLTQEKLKSLYRKASPAGDQRFDEIDETFEAIRKAENSVKIIGETVTIGGRELFYINDAGVRKRPSIEFFGPSKDHMTVNQAYSGVRQMSEKFEFCQELARKIGCILGGFDFDSHQMIDKYRILSNTITRKDDYDGSLTSKGQSRHPSSNFADNNYFFNIMEFIQHADEKQFEEIRMVLRYPSNHVNEQGGHYTGHKSYFFVEGDDESCAQEYKKQKEVLISRFPLKFLWMWANKHRVIHPVSLMAFRNFLNTEFGRDVLENVNKELTPASVTNMEFEEFKTDWKSISDQILLDILGKNGVDAGEITKLSKWISQVSMEETDIKNIADLLTTGNKAVILWGPPGTGKTYESLEVVRELLEIGEDENLEENYLFSKGPADRNTKGYFEIVQFHPNYTYQEFIGGIFPKLEEGGKEVSYTLRHGVFKRFCDAAADASDKKFIFIIDEINRAELSAVFGELLYALEYRGKSIFLPHFGEFAIQKNVYIIGTMNNVDKSLVTFDLALRRRFGFFKLMPKPEVIKDALSGRVDEASLTPYYDRCTALNEAIVGQLDLGEDYQIGQAYFLKIGDFLPPAEAGDALPPITSFELEKLWLYHIEPLLEEYLGMSIEDEGIAGNLSALKDPFTEEL